MHRAFFYSPGQQLGMVVEDDYQGTDAYRCEACGFHYRDREQAEECERYCRENNSCSRSITAESMERA